MKRITLLLAVAAVALTSVAYAASKKHHAPKMTCEEFAAQTPESQTRVAAFLDGYSKRGTKVEALSDVEVDRELDVLVVACKQEPKATLWDKIKAHMPGGKKKLKPVAMTCEDFLSLESDVQPEVAYWLDGYNRKTNTEVEASGEVDLERDIAVLVEVCKPTPKAPLWERIKSQLSLAPSLGTSFGGLLGLRGQLRPARHPGEARAVAKDQRGRGAGLELTRSPTPALARVVALALPPGCGEIRHVSRTPAGRNPPEW